MIYRITPLTAFLSGTEIGFLLSVFLKPTALTCVVRVLGRLATSSRCTSKAQPAVDVQARSELVKWRLQVLGCC
jgi:hypothetical protein